MKIDTTATTVSATFTLAEISALLRHASDDESRPMLTAIRIEPAARAVVATDGHRLICGVAALQQRDGETDRDYGERCKAEPGISAVAYRSDGREISIRRADVEAITKAARKGDAVRFTWPASGKPEREIVCEVLAKGVAPTATIKAHGSAVAFPTWRHAVENHRPRDLSRLAVASAAYLADCFAALAKLSDSKLTPAVQIWTCEAPTTTRDGTSTGAVLVTMTADSAGLGDRWTCLVMALRYDAAAVRDPWARQADPKGVTAPEAVEAVAA